MGLFQKIKNLFSSNKKSEKVFLPKIDVQESPNYYYFCSKVSELIKFDTLPLTQKKNILYKKFTAALTEGDKSQVIQYFRCKEDAKFLKNVQNLQQPLIINQTETSYQYQPSNTKLQWFVNFADQHLFGYYHTDLFAQDEIQCAEHPLLSHVREVAKLKAGGVKPITYEKEPTPILIKNVHRLGQVDISGTPEYKSGLYGNNFKYANQSYIDKMSKAFAENKNLTNFICMAALGYGSGKYTQNQIKFLYNTAYKSFACAKEQSNGMAVDLHTGNWGCGAFGNNKQLIACIQLFAVHLSGVEEITYHTFNAEGTQGFIEGKQLYEQFLSEYKSQMFQNSDAVDQLFINFLFSKHFNWGKSDGN